MVRVDDREFIVVGTAHISRESADLVREVIERERPDSVCIELDDQRFEALSNPTRFESLDLKQVLRSRQLATLMLSLVLATYQRRLGFKLGIQPGTELMEAARVAKELDIPIALCDRDVRITLRRAWAALSLPRKFLLLSSLLAGIFDKVELSEEDLRELRSEDVLSRLLRELGEAFPGLKTVLIDERDEYLTQRMKEAPGRRVVSVVGAGHVEGIKNALAGGRSARIVELEQIPRSPVGWKWLGWGIPALIIAGLVTIGVRHGAAAAGENILFWILANGIPSALGATLALGHPATIVSAFLAAPITSLTPVIGAGYVTAFVQSYLRPPLVRELRRVSEDVASLTGWWRNRLLRIFLVFTLSTLGSLLGTVVGGAEILSNLF